MARTYQALTGLGAAAVRPYLQHLVTDAFATPEGPDGSMRYRAIRREP